MTGDPPSIGDRVSRHLRRRIVDQVRATFNDRARGEAPVMRSADGLFAPGAVIWRVHGDVTSMMVGGVAALLLQMLHPRVLGGVWDHSGFRDDMLGRLRRTARFIALTTFGERAAADAVIARVRRIHDHVHGTLPDGTPYSANDPALLAWVHVSEATCFLDGWIRYGEPRMTIPDQDRYFAEFAQIARAMGADPVPRTRAAAARLVRDMRPELAASARSREVARLVLHAPPRSLAAAPVQGLTAQAAVDLLPGWARTLHGLKSPILTRPLVHAGTTGIARTLRWAFAG